MNQFLSNLFFLPLLSVVLLSFLGLIFYEKKEFRQIFNYLTFTIGAIFCLATIFLSGWFLFLHPPEGLYVNIPWIPSYFVELEIVLEGTSAPILMVISVVFLVFYVRRFFLKKHDFFKNLFLFIFHFIVFGLLVSDDLFLLSTFYILAPFSFYLLVIEGFKEIKTPLQLAPFIHLISGGGFFLIIVFLLNGNAAPHVFSIRDLSGGIFNNVYLDFFGFHPSISDIGFLLLFGATAFRIPVWPLSKWYKNLMEFIPFDSKILFVTTFTLTHFYLFLKIAFLIFPSSINHFRGFFEILTFVGVVSSVLGMLQAKKIISYYSTLACFLFSVVWFAIFIATYESVLGGMLLALLSSVSLLGIGLIFQIIIEETHGKLEVPPRGVAWKGVSLFDYSPQLAVMAGFFFLSLLGVPFIGGFYAQFFIMNSVFHSNIFLFFGLLISYLIVTFVLLRYLHVLFWEQKFLENEQKISQIFNVLFVFLLVTLLAAGLYPEPLIRAMQPEVAGWTELFSGF